MCPRKFSRLLTEPPLAEFDCTSTSQKREKGREICIEKGPFISREKKEKDKGLSWKKNTRKKMHRKHWRRGRGECKRRTRFSYKKKWSFLLASTCCFTMFAQLSPSSRANSRPPSQRNANSGKEKGHPPSLPHCIPKMKMGWGRERERERKTENGKKQASQPCKSFLFFLLLWYTTTSSRAFSKYR